MADLDLTDLTQDDAAKEYNVHTIDEAEFAMGRQLFFLQPIHRLLMFMMGQNRPKSQLMFTVQSVQGIPGLHVRQNLNIISKSKMRSGRRRGS